MGRAQNNVSASRGFDDLRRSVQPSRVALAQASSRSQRPGAAARDPDKAASIYALIDPETDEPRYIGKTKQGRLAYRLGQHLTAARSGSANSAKDRWIREVLKTGVEPRIELLEDVPEANWEAHEIYWIAGAKAAGFRLTNTNAGGDGGTGPVPIWTPEVIHAELTAFCAGMTEYPTGAVFRAAGRMNLWAAIEKGGGHDHWAADIGLPRPSKLVPWTRERVEEGLEQLCQGRTTYPTQREFVAAGQERLFFAVYGHGGHENWASQLSLPLVREERPVKWTDEAIEEAIMTLARGSAFYPTWRQFREAGLHGLAVLLDTREQGHDFWAERLGLTRFSSGARKGALNGRHKWSDDRLETEVSEFCSGRTAYPSRAEFAAAGKSALWEALHKNGGHPHWSAKVGLPMKGKGNTGRRRWNDASIEASVRSIPTSGGGYPTKDEFQQAGLEGLYQMIGREYGGHDHWAEKLGLQRKLSLWSSDEKIEAAIREQFINKGFTTWPSSAQFKQAGLGGLQQHLTANKLHEEWASRLGLPRSSARGRNPTWDRTTATAAMEDLCAGRSVYPSPSEFEDAGLGSLYTVIESMPGGHEQQATLIGLSWHEPDAGKRPQKWVSETISLALTDAFGGQERTTWPKAREFSDVGLSGLYHHLTVTGTAAVWAEHMGWQITRKRPST